MRPRDIGSSSTRALPTIAVQPRGALCRALEEATSASLSNTGRRWCEERGEGGASTRTVSPLSPHTPRAGRSVTPFTLGRSRGGEGRESHLRGFGSLNQSGQNCSPLSPAEWLIGKRDLLHRRSLSSEPTGSQIGVVFRRRSPSDTLVMSDQV